MRTTVAVLSCLAATTIALVIPPTDQAPLVQDEPLAVVTSSAKPAVSSSQPVPASVPILVEEQLDEFPVLIIIRPTVDNDDEAADADVDAGTELEDDEVDELLPKLLVDGPMEPAEASEQDSSVVERDDGGIAEEEPESCFCAGGAVCCVKDGETDCGYGTCSI